MSQTGAGVPTAAALANEAWEATRDALQHYTESNLRRFAAEAARAIELAGKAILASINPVLIADPRHVDSQLHFAGIAVARAKGDVVIRTIGCREVLDRVSRILPAVRPVDIGPIIDARDGSAHFLVSNRRALEGLVVPFLAVLATLQNRLGATDSIVFGQYAELVAALRKEHTKRVDRIVSAKIARARRVFEERYSHLDEKGKSAVFSAIESGYLLTAYDELLIDCPACKHQAVISGDHEFQGWVPDGDEGMGAYPEVQLFANALKCGVCGLHLDGDDELEALDLPTILDVEDVDPSDFYEDWDDRDD
jgi:hypothetical protein